MKPKHENWAPIQMLCHMPNVHLKPNQGQRNNASRKYLSLYLFVHYKFRSSTVTDKQSACLNIASVHLSAFADFANIFIRYRSKQSTSELSLLAIEMFPLRLFSYKEIIILTEWKSQ